MPVYMYLIVFKDCGEVTSEIWITSEKVLQKPPYIQESRPEKNYSSSSWPSGRKFVLINLQWTKDIAFFILKKNQDKKCEIITGLSLGSILIPCLQSYTT